MIIRRDAKLLRRYNVFITYTKFQMFSTKLIHLIRKYKNNIT